MTTLNLEEEKSASTVYIVYIWCEFMILWTETTTAGDGGSRGNKIWTMTSRSWLCMCFCLTITVAITRAQNITDPAEGITSSLCVLFYALILHAIKLWSPILHGCFSFLPCVCLLVREKFVLFFIQILI